MAVTKKRSKKNSKLYDERMKMPTLEEVEIKTAKKRDNEVEEKVNEILTVDVSLEEKLAEANAKIAELEEQREEESDPDNVGVNSNWDVVFDVFKEAIEKESKDVKVSKKKNFAVLEKPCGQKGSTRCEIHETRNLLLPHD